MDMYSRMNARERVCVRVRERVRAHHITLVCVHSAWYDNQLHPKFMEYFAAELTLEELFFKAHDLPTYAKGVNGSTIGAMYTNGQHKDLKDAGYTKLPVLGNPSGGGHFAHGVYGVAQHLAQGEIDR